MEVLKRTEIDGRDLKIIANLYWNQSPVFRIDGEYIDHVNILRGVRQGAS
ncbi:unnamed protein product [Diabrotica balteata]|uniref:Uncharacterized protein n=1 Tax=Diabrotica balteata TaxID=107213 RepID=A0A9N9SVB7_DIABA|nr:unnamed protein product [Diabrotica balteata]